MVAPRNAAVPGAPYGFNGKISHATLGRRYVRVGTIRRGLAINTAEDAASQAKTMYPLYVSQDSISLTLLHRTHAERNRLNNWIKRFMDRSSSARLSHNYLDFSVPSRRFQRRAVIQGTLTYGEDVRDGMLTTTLVLVGAADPVRRYTDRSRMRLSQTDLVSAYFYPAGVQTGWGVEEVYDTPAPIRPGQPNRPV